MISGSTITTVGEGDVEIEDALEIDAIGNYVSAGFIDIHVHGGGGHDFMDCDETGFLKIAETHARHGTTSMLPTTLSCDHDELITTLDIYREADKKKYQRCTLPRHAYRRSLLCDEPEGCPGSQIHQST